MGWHVSDVLALIRGYHLDSDGPVPLSLPAQWLWDIIDEFVYQFQSFALFRSRPASKTDDKLAMPGSEGCAQVWSSYSILNILYHLIQKSHVNEWLKARAEGKTDHETEYVHHLRVASTRWTRDTGTLQASMAGTHCIASLGISRSLDSSVSMSFSVTLRLRSKSWNKWGTGSVWVRKHRSQRPLRPMLVPHTMLACVT